MSSSQPVLDAFVQRRSAFVHRQTLHRAATLDAARFQAALEQQLADNLLAPAASGFCGALVAAVAVVLRRSGASRKVPRGCGSDPVWKARGIPEFR